MAINVKVLGKHRVAYGTEVEISYTCPFCGEHVTDWICFGNDIENCVAEVYDHDCPECGESSDLDVDMY